MQSIGERRTQVGVNISINIPGYTVREKKRRRRRIYSNHRGINAIHGGNRYMESQACLDPLAAPLKACASKRYTSARCGSGHSDYRGRWHEPRRMKGFSECGSRRGYS